MKDIKKEDISNLSYKDIAYMILEKKEKGENTLDLFTEIINILELPSNVIDTKIADFYTSLTTDKRFVMVDGLWDLRIHHTSDKVLSQVDEEDEEEIVDDIDDDEETNNDSYEEDDLDDSNYDSDDDDGLSDLVIVDEDEMDMES